MAEEKKILPESNKPPLLPDDIHLSIDEIRQELFRMHDFAVDRDDPALMYVTIMNACLDEQKKLMDAHLNALSAVMARETGASIAATKENVAALAGLMSRLTTDGIKEAARDMAGLQATMKLCTAVMFVSALLVVGSFVLRATGGGL